MFLFKSLQKLPAFLSKAPRFLFAFHYKTESLLKDFSTKDLTISKNIKQVLRNTSIPKKTKRSQKGLFHKKRIQTGNQTCFSEKKSRRKWRPNIIKGHFYSKILNRSFRLEVSTTAYRCIRKFGGFDNYILLTEPKDLDSIYGEYLRKLILLKLNNPAFRVPYITRACDFHFKHKRRHQKLKAMVYFPPHLRDVDKNLLLLKEPSMMNRHEIQKFNEVNALIDKFEDIPTNHPLIKEFEENEEADLKALEPDRLKIIEKLNRMKSKKKCKLLTEYNEKAEQDLLDGEEGEYINERQARKMRRNEKKAKKEEKNIKK